MAELSCTGVSKAFGERTVLRHVDLTVPSGTLTAILGASGSGKTTLLRIVMGFVAADAGTVRAGAETLVDDARAVPAHKRAIGYVAQEGALFPHLTVGENTAFGLPRAQRATDPRVGEVLRLVGLDESYADRGAHELSGGEQRRVALARALAPRPRVVLLDEPFSGLDAALRAETRAAVLTALAQEGTTALLVTHDQSEALSMGDEVAVLRGGTLVQRATPAELYRLPVDADVARFVGDAALLPGSCRRSRVACGLGELDVAGPGHDGPVQVMVRPEQIELQPAGAPGVPARVLDHTYFGPDATVRLVLDDDTVVQARTFARDLPAAGSTAQLAVRGPVVIYPRESP